MERLEKEARPPDAVTVVVPDRIPPPGLVPMATVMLAAELVTVFPNVSCTATWTAGLTATPAVALVGCAVKASRFAAAGLTLNAALDAPVSAAEAAFRV